MATEPLRIRILKNLTALLQTISTANGYHTELDGNVFRGRSVFGDDDPLPMVSILEAPIPLDQALTPEGSAYGQGGWELVIQGFVVDDPENPTDPAHYFLADVRQCLAIESRKASQGAGPDIPANGILGLGSEITRLGLGQGVVRPSDEISAKAYFWLIIALQLVEDVADPYGD